MRLVCTNLVLSQLRRGSGLERATTLNSSEDREFLINSTLSNRSSLAANICIYILTRDVRVVWLHASIVSHSIKILKRQRQRRYNDAAAKIQRRGYTIRMDYTSRDRNQNCTRRRQLTTNGLRKKLSNECEQCGDGHSACKLD